MWTKCRNSCEQKRLLLVAVVLLSLLLLLFIPAICLFLFPVLQEQCRKQYIYRITHWWCRWLQKALLFWMITTLIMWRFTITLITRARVGHGDRQGCENSLEMVIEQVRLEGGFKRGGKIRLAESLSQTVPNRWASVRKRSFTKCFCVYTRGDKGSCVECGS